MITEDDKRKLFRDEEIDDKAGSLCLNRLSLCAVMMKWQNLITCSLNSWTW
mgnify:FL=1|jgi:hypothetical protein